MGGNVESIDQKHASGVPDGKPKKSAKKQGHSYSCELSFRRFAGLAALVAAVTALAFAVVFACGIFGGGEKEIFAAVLTIGSMGGFASAAFLLLGGKTTA